MKTQLSVVLCNLFFAFVVADDEAKSDFVFIPIPEDKIIKDHVESSSDSSNNYSKRSIQFNYKRNNYRIEIFNHSAFGGLYFSCLAFSQAIENNPLYWDQRSSPENLIDAFQQYSLSHGLFFKHKTNPSLKGFILQNSFATGEENYSAGVLLLAEEDKSSCFHWSYSDGEFKYEKGIPERMIQNLRPVFLHFEKFHDGWSW